MDPNPYQAPVSSEPAAHRAPDVPLVDGEVDEQIQLTRRSGAVTAAAGLCAASGAVLLLAALQLWDLFALRGAYRVAPVAMAVAGLLGIVLGLKLYRQRVWASVMALSLFAIVAPAMGVWFLLALGSGFLSLAGLFAPLLAALAAVFSGLAIGPCRRTTLARRRLAASGLDIDF